MVSLPGIATDSDGTIATRAWTQTAGAPTVTLTNANTGTASFTAPNVAVNTPLTFRFTATDNDGASASDTIVVTITPAGGNPAPVANAGADKSVVINTAGVTLPGSGTDTPPGTIASFAWTQVSGTAVTLANANTATASFTAPGTPGALTFRLTVTDNGGATDTDDVVVTVTAIANNPPVAGAGSDKTAASGSVVQLPGTEADTDGTIASRAWTQVAGAPTVTLNNANTLTANFTAPSVAVNTPLTFRLTVTDDDGATDTDDIIVTITPAAAGTVTISGKVTYARVQHAGNGALDYANVDTLPARGITVQAVNAGTGGVIATTTTVSTAGATAGNYSLNVPQNTNVIIRALAEVKDGAPAPTWDFAVVDNRAAEAVYKLDSAATSSGTVNSTRNLHAGTGFNASGVVTGARDAAPFAIADTLFSALSVILEVDLTQTFPALKVGWNATNSDDGGGPGNGTTNPICATSGQIGGSFFQDDRICLVGEADDDTDEYDDDVITRLFGRYILANFGRTDYPEGFPGGHNEGDRLDMRVAFNEGLLLAFTGVVGDGVYEDSNGANQQGGFAIDLESNTVANPGWYNEGSVRSILYDIYDGANDGADTVSLGFQPIYDIIIGTMDDAVALSSIFPFVTEIKARHAASAAAIGTLVNGQSIVGSTINDFGTTETNNAGNAQDVLPVYTQLTLNAAPVQVCTTDAFQGFNGLSVRRFLRFTLGAATNVTIRVTGPVGSDPDAFLYRDGVVAVGNSGDPASEEFMANLTAGQYVLEVLDFNLSGRSCLDVSVTG